MDEHNLQVQVVYEFPLHCFSRYLITIDQVENMPILVI